jgi:DNA-binding MarR family transcriptional regulator
MSSNKSPDFWSSINRRSSAIPILELLTQNTELSFGQIMEKIKISKKGLYLTLSDLEKDGLIKRKKSGKFTIVNITKEGEQALITLFTAENEQDGLIDQILNETILCLKKEGILSSDWNEKQKSDFISKMKSTLQKQLQHKENSE